jgi:histidine triad (HIT) family protein
MVSCLFCKIASKEIPAEIIYEDDAAVGFLDIQPIAPGHTLIIPKHHTATLRDLPEDLIGPVFEAVRRASQMLVQSLEPNGLSYGINEGAVTGQTIEHLHIHIAPRFENDGGKSFHSIVQNPPAETLKSIADKIRRAKDNF